LTFTRSASRVLVVMVVRRRRYVARSEAVLAGAARIAPAVADYFPGILSPGDPPL